MADQDHAAQVIALACSAGGLAALTEVLSALPVTFPAAVVVALHQPAAAADVLADLLEASCALPVRAARDGDPLVPGQILVAGGGVHVLTTPQGTVALLQAEGGVPPKPSADLLFTSLALSCGPRAVAVVLTGGGVDGAAGATAVHRFGGTVIAASTGTSAHPQMPRATAQRDHITDHVVDQGEVASLLVALTPPRGHGPAHAVHGPV